MQGERLPDMFGGFTQVSLRMATTYPIPRRHPTATANHDVFYELAERSPLLTPYTRENSVVLSCIAAMRKETESLRKQAEACEEKAIHYLNSALAIHCDRPQLYLQRGLAYWRIGDVEAMALYGLFQCNKPGIEPFCVIALWLCSGSGHVHSSPSTAAAHFFRALGRVKCGHITGALADLRTCKNKLRFDSRAGSCANQEFYYVERLLARQRRYCDAAAVAAAAEACAAREARGVALAKEALAQGSAVRREWRTRILHEQQAVAALQQPNAPEESTDIPTVLRINTQAKSCEDPSPVQSPRSVASWPVSSAPSSPPDSPRQAEVAPAQQCLTAGDARAEAALQQWEDFCAMVCQQRKAMSAPATAADKTSYVPSSLTTRTLFSSHKETTSDLPVSPRSVASWPASSAAASSPPESSRQAEVAPAQQCLTAGNARAEAALQQAEMLVQPPHASGGPDFPPSCAGNTQPQLLAVPAPHPSRQGKPLPAVTPTELNPIASHWAHGGTETDVSLKTAASAPSDSLRHADVAPAQPGDSSAPEQPAAASAEHGFATQAEAPPSPVCLCMHEDGATKALTPLERYRHAVSRHPCCSCGRYCKPSDGQQHNPHILAALATMKKEAEVYLRQLKTSQPHTGTDGLQPSSHEQSALSSATAGANQEGCKVTRAPQPQPTSAAASSCAPAEAACKKKEKKKGKKRKGHGRRA
ncbi:g5633 [Coccomyxa elongata]